MKAIDLQCQMVTKWGSFLPPEMASQFENYLGTKLAYGKTDEEMAQVFRDADVKAMVVIPTSNITDDIGKVRELNDRSAQFQKDYSDAILGIWASVNPQLGYKGLRELERCIKDLGFVGYYMMSITAGVPINDKLMYPFLDLCCDAGVPVRWNVGHTAGGAGLPGGGGYHLGNERPIPFFDDAKPMSTPKTMVGLQNTCQQRSRGRSGGGFRIGLCSDQIIPSFHMRGYLQNGRLRGTRPRY
jgi:predicted TIM-barrel fold metal-dependent hydrolase